MIASTSSEVSGVLENRRVDFMLAAYALTSSSQGQTLPTELCKNYVHTIPCIKLRLKNCLSKATVPFLHN
jgi:hypothetical protein